MGMRSAVCVRRPSEQAAGRRSDAQECRRTRARCGRGRGEAPAAVPAGQQGDSGVARRGQDGEGESGRTDGRTAVTEDEDGQPGQGAGHRQGAAAAQAFAQHQPGGQGRQIAKRFPSRA